MFCIQCEQTIRTPQASGCVSAQGMCGKTAEVSDLQDILVKSMQSVSHWALLAREYHIVDPEIDRWSIQAFFATLTNVNFDPERFIDYIHKSEVYKNKMQTLVTKAAQAAGNPLPELTGNIKTITLPESAASVRTS